MTLNRFKFFSICYFVVIFLLSINIKRYGFEQDIYQVKYESLIHDRDLNIVNNISNEFNLLLTPTDNVGDMHDHGAPILWATTIELLNFIFQDIRFFDFQLTPNQRLSGDWTVITLLYIFLVYFLRRWMVKNRTEEFIFWTLLFSLGVHDNLLDQIFNADIFAMVIMGFILTKYIRPTTEESPISHYELGFLMGILRFVKLTSVLYLPAVFFTSIYKIESWKERISFTLRFGISYALIFLTITMNNYINLGSWNFLQGYNYSYFWNGFLRFNGWKATYLFPRGLFTHSTLLLFSVPIIIWITRKWIKTKSYSSLNIFLTLSTISIFFKLALPFFCPSDHYLTLGARQFYIDIPVLFFFLSFFQKSKPKLMISFQLISVVTAIYFNSEWIQLNKDPELFSYTPLLNFKENIIHIISFFPYFLERFTYSIRSAFFQTNVFILYSLFVLISVLLSKLTKKRISQSIFVFVLTTIFIGYSLLNLGRNEPNTSVYFSKHGYNDKIIGGGGDLYLFHEINSGMALGRNYDHLYGNRKSQKDLKTVHYDFINKLSKDIIFIGPSIAKKELKSGYLPKKMNYNIDLLEVIQRK